MFNLTNIYEGWKNYLTDNPEMLTVAKERAVHCGDCKHSIIGDIIKWFGDDVKIIQGMMCELCSCPLSALLRAPESECELNKWGKVSKSGDRSTNSGDLSQ